jgi:N-formylglutamate deformylase
VTRTFDVFAPTGAESPVVVEIPHAGLVIDPVAMAYTVAPVRGVGRDADLHVDRVYEDAAARGASVIVARTSRYVVDLNRGPADFDGVAVEGGGATPLPRGLVWRLTTEGEPILARRLPRAELERRMTTIYEPYHHAVRGLLHDKRERFGFAILLCAHSMPSQGRRGHQDAGAVRVDVVPGSRGRTSAAAAVIDAVEHVARQHDLTVKHDDPYKGGFATAHYGKPAEGFHAIQIELARRLYMDEDLLGLDAVGLPRMQRYAGDVVEALGRLRLPRFTG